MFVFVVRDACAGGRVESHIIGVTNPNLCPLCGAAEHPGKCEKESRTTWWCGRCLVSKLAEAESDINRPVLSAQTLRAANIKRTRYFCRFCALPLCDVHARDNPNMGHRRYACHVDCAVEPLKSRALLVKALDAYVPDWRRAGPRRCEVCNAPYYKHTVCERHYAQARRGRKVLVANRLRKRRTTKHVPMSFALPIELKETVDRIAEVEGSTISAYLEAVVRKDLRRRAQLIKDAAKSTQPKP